MQMLLKLDHQLIKRLLTFKKTGKDMPACSNLIQHLQTLLVQLNACVSAQLSICLLLHSEQFVFPLGGKFF